MFANVPSTYDEIKDWRWAEFAPYAEKLLATEIATDNIEDWLAGYSQLQNLISEVASRAEVSISQDSTNQNVVQRYTTFTTEILPEAMKAGNLLDRKLVDCGIVPPGMEIPLLKTRTGLELFREENLALVSEERKLTTEYAQVMSTQTVEWEGQEITLSQLGPALSDVNRERRETAFRLMNERVWQDRDKLNDIWSRSLDVRHQMAKNADMPDFRAYRWKQMNRFDYTVDDALAFFDAIEQAVVPVQERLYNKRREKLGLDTLRPWDTGVDLKGREPLKPYSGDTQELKDKMVSLFNTLDPELGQYLAIMRDEGYLDLDSRKGKAPRGFMVFYHLSKRPFIFMNAVSIHQDVQTMLHESGHAFHGFASAELPYQQQQSVPMEFAEVASMSMELLGAPYLTTEQGGFYSPADAARARIDKLTELPYWWCWIAAIAGFQHWAYTHIEEAHDPEQCDDVWVSLMNRYLKGVDWSELEKYQRNRWRMQGHIYNQPFYYIEYGLAQLGAVQVWANSLKDEQQALANYRQALTLGGTVSLPDLYAAAGARLAFDAQTLHEAATLIENTIEELEAVE